MKPCIRTHSGDAMMIGSTPAITGQMAHIVFALKALRQDAKVPPLNRLTAESATKH
jgi:hypothetical protein